MIWERVRCSVSLLFSTTVHGQPLSKVSVSHNASSCVNELFAVLIQIFEKRMQRRINGNCCQLYTG